MAVKAPDYKIYLKATMFPSAKTFFFFFFLHSTSSDAAPRYEASTPNALFPAKDYNAGVFSVCQLCPGTSLGVTKSNKESIGFELKCFQVLTTWLTGISYFSHMQCLSSVLESHLMQGLNTKNV